MRTLTIPEFHAELKAQGVGRREDIAFVCPVCGTVQSGADWMAATGKPFDEIEPVIGFSCIGRETGAGPHKAGTAPGKGCDWTLGGLLRIHQLEIVGEDGQRHAMFEPASADLAQQHALQRRQQAGAP